MRCSILLALIFCGSTYAADLDVISQATCKVNGGTGVAFTEDATHVWIITAGHCVLSDTGKKEKTTVRFYHTGFESHPMSAEILSAVFKKRTVDDVAILKVNKEHFLDYPLPKPIPLGASDALLTKDDLVMSFGCARAQWPTGWKGHVRSIGSNSFKFSPPPLPGRSGSGIFDMEGKHILGIIIWRDGTAVSLSHIHKLMAAKE